MITNVRLQNFRSYKDAAFDLNPAVNIVVGPNASGKTNLLEALLVLAIGKSYRAGNDELIKIDQPWARIEGHTKDTSRVIKIEGRSSGSKSFEIDKKIYRRLPLEQTLPVILFEPQHLLILSGRPELRRDYLDDLLEKTNPGFGKARRDYKRALAQRNSLLKKGGQQVRQQIFAWNIRLSETGALVAGWRRDLIEKLNEKIPETYRKLSNGGKNIELSYASPLPTENYGTSLLHMLEKNIELDIARGFTGIGPHREDMTVTIDGRLVQDTASRGEIRTIVLALKILELTILEKARGQRPLILLDDVFSELDGSRRQALTNYLKDYQTFITTTDADIIQHHFADASNVIALSSKD